MIFCLPSFASIWGEMPHWQRYKKNSPFPIRITTTTMITVIIILHSSLHRRQKVRVNPIFASLSCSFLWIKRTFVPQQNKLGWIEQWDASLFFMTPYASWGNHEYITLSTHKNFACHVCFSVSALTYTGYFFCWPHACWTFWNVEYSAFVFYEKMLLNISYIFIAPCILFM